jgi:uracil-DNA glycosylase
MTDAADREELHFLARALRAHLEWQLDTGASGSTRTEIAPAPPAAPQSSAGAPLTMSLAPAASQPSAYRASGAPSGPPQTLRSSAELADVERRLTLLAQTVQSCTRCELAKHRTQTVFARGTGSSGVCFVGEGPGQDEDLQGLPFVGKAGQLLDRMIEAMGLGRDEVYVCNIVKCRPPDNRKPELEEVAACMPYLNQQLELLAPRVIVALGATALQGLFGTTEGIMRARGKWRSLGGQIDVMPTFHPAYLLRNPAAKREVWTDLQEVLRHIGQSVPVRR